MNDENFFVEMDEAIDTGTTGTQDFNSLYNRPSYDGQAMTSSTNIPVVPEKVSDLNNDAGFQTAAAVSAAIAEESSARQSADADLHASIEAEASARQSADAGLQNNIDSEASARQAADTTLNGQVSDISAKIPAQASAENQLADKDYVNSSISTNTAYYISNDGEPFESVEALESYAGALTNNDYAFVKGTDAAGNATYTRYKYNAEAEEWAAEYVLNNSSFTAEQWAAISSGITSGAVERLAGLANIKSIGANLTLDAETGELDAINTTYTAGTGLTLSDGEFSVDTETIATQADLTTGLATKQNTLIAGENITIEGDMISASGAQSTLYELTEADYNWPTDNPTGVALWLLPSGFYMAGKATAYFDNSQYWPNGVRYKTYMVDQTNGTYATIWAYNNTITASVRDLAQVFSVMKTNGQRMIALAVNSIYVTDNLASTSIYNALSANQGKVLNDKIEALTARVEALEG